jgi:pimeloyl-ACP methyl ester carboxylesterase
MIALSSTNLHLLDRNFKSPSDRSFSLINKKTAIALPLLVLWGENDPLTPIAGSTLYQERAKSDEKTEFYPISQAGHFPHDEKPELVNAFILDWLAKYHYTWIS